MPNLDSLDQWWSDWNDHIAKFEGQNLIAEQAPNPVSLEDRFNLLEQRREKLNEFHERYRTAKSESIHSDSEKLRPLQALGNERTKLNSIEKELKWEQFKEAYPQRKESMLAEVQDQEGLHDDRLEELQQLEEPFSLELNEITVIQNFLGPLQQSGQGARTTARPEGAPESFDSPAHLRNWVMQQTNSSPNTNLWIQQQVHQMRARCQGELNRIQLMRQNEAAFGVDLQNMQTQLDELEPIDENRDQLLDLERQVNSLEDRCTELRDALDDFQEIEEESLEIASPSTSQESETETEVVARENSGAAAQIERPNMPASTPWYVARIQSQITREIRDRIDAPEHKRLEVAQHISRTLYGDHGLAESIREEIGAKMGEMGMHPPPTDKMMQDRPGVINEAVRSRLWQAVTNDRLNELKTNAEQEISARRSQGEAQSQDNPKKRKRD